MSASAAVTRYLFAMSSTEAAAATPAPAAEPVSLLPFREWLLSTLPASAAPAAERRAELLDDKKTLIADFYEAVSALVPASATGVAPNALRWDIPASVIPSLGANLIAATNATLDAVAAVPSGAHTFANTLGAMAEADRRSQALHSSVTFVADVHPDKDVRDAANAAQEAIQANNVDANARVDVYESVSAFSATAEAAALTGEYKRLLDHTMRDYIREGMALAPEPRAKLVEIKKRMSSLAINFHKNVAEEDTRFVFTRAQLAGLSEAQLSKLTKVAPAADAAAGAAEDSFEVTLKTPDYIPVMEYCSVSATRAKLEKAYNSRCLEANTPIIEEIVALRAQQAKLLGFPTHAAFILDTRMGKTPEAVASFLDSLNGKLGPLFAQEQAALLKLKEAEVGVEAAGGKLNAYDRAYYSRIYEETEYKVDHEALKEFFPLEHVTRAMFGIYERIFSIKIVKAEAPAWHESVSFYKVLEAAADAPASEQGAELGQFYMDLHPRKGKYSHAAVFTLLCPCELPSGARAQPAAALVCNFPAGTAEEPALLPHKDVVTFLHEFGHCIHLMLGKPKLQRFEGLNIERDAVEAPSQLLENWAYSAESLALLAKHYKDEGRTLPASDVDALIKSEIALAGAFNKRQLVFGIVDQRMHTRETVDTAALYRQTMLDVMGVEPTPGTNMIAAFGHLAGGYDAQYYGYLWSEVFASDMFHSRFAKEGVLNPAVGLDYRRKILEKASTEDAAVLLRDFLGRDPTDDAFLKSKGL